MKTLIGIAAALALLGCAATSVAQTKPAPDPVRLDLARQVLDATGGAQAMETRMRSLFGSITDMAKKSAIIDDHGMAEALVKYMTEAEVKAIPKLLDDTAEVYAENLTETELRDMLAWNRTESARSIRAKMTTMTQELMVRQQPLIKSMIGGMMKSAVDKTCEERKCTDDQRKALAGFAATVAPGS